MFCTSLREKAWANRKTLLYQVVGCFVANPDTGKRAGVQHFGFHAIRYYVASFSAVKQKVSITQAIRLLRRQSNATRERYLQVIDPQLRGRLWRAWKKWIGQDQKEFLLNSEQLYR
jgi:hypothetical protein